MRILIIALALLLLAGCGTNEIKVSTTPVERAPLILPAIDRFQARDVQWRIITPDNYQEVIRHLRASKKNVALFALTDKDYENLGLNFADIQTIVRQQQAIIEAMQEYYMLTGEKPVLDESASEEEKNILERLF
jgi:hypothetical protein